MFQKTPTIQMIHQTLLIGMTTIIPITATQTMIQIQATTMVMMKTIVMITTMVMIAAMKIPIMKRPMRTILTLMKAVIMNKVTMIQRIKKKILMIMGTPMPIVKKVKATVRIPITKKLAAAMKMLTIMHWTVREQLVML